MKPCERCGVVHERDGRPACVGHSSRTGKACRNFPIDGGTVCGTHGGRAPQVRDKAARTVELRRAIELVDTFGEPQEGDPFDIILEEIARTNGHVLWLGQMVATLEERDVAWGETGREDVDSDGPTGSHVKVTHAAGVNVWIQLYQSERAHLVKVCKEAISLGIAERQVRIAEQTGQLLAKVLKATMADPELGLTPAAQEVAHRVISRHLRSLPTAG